ncbi:MAG: hypothetical protein FJ100_12970 [Deltaproteobacteria bacterium]|nr:hypothetical protein [Deltaproteobacteria bacterium]
MNPNLCQKVGLRVAIWLVALTVASSAFAVSPATTRTLRNLDSVFKALRLEEVTKGTASVTVDELDYAIRRGNELQTLDEADKGDPAVQAMRQRLADIAAFRERLVQARSAAKAANDAQRERMQAFAEESKPFARGLSLFPEASGSRLEAVNVTAEGLQEGMRELAALDALCKAKYADLKLKPCDAAARRQALAAAMVEAKVANDCKQWVDTMVATKSGLASKHGFLSPTGSIGRDLLYDREKGKATLLAAHKPLLAAAGLAVPAELFAPLDKAIDELWAEVDRLAPGLQFPAKVHSDRALEQGAKSELAAVASGAKVVKTGMLYADWAVAKNALDIPTEKYRTGGILYKSAESKWCQYREFTAHLAYEGGGKYAGKPTWRFGPPRYQGCP